MSGQRTQPQAHRRGYSWDPLIIDRTPLIIDRSPEDLPVRRASVSDTRKPGDHSSRLRIYNPFSRRNRNSLLVVNSSLGPISGRGRPSSPPPPPIVHQLRSRSQPPVQRVSEMPPTQGQKGFVPLPPKLSTPEEEQHRSQERESRREGGSGRESRQSRQSQLPEDIVHIVEEPDRSRRSPRHYHHRSVPSDPYADQEQVLEPSSPRMRQTDNFEIVQPNEPIRSRQRNNDVRTSKEYIRMKEIAERNYKAAEEAAQRYSTAEVRLQNLQKQLADMTLQQNKNLEIQDDLRNKLEAAYRELDDLRLRQASDRQINARQRELIEHQTELAKSQRELQRQTDHEHERERERERERDRRKDREAERTRESSGRDSGSGSDRRRRRRHQVISVHQGRDTEPRTVDPRTSLNTATARPAPNDSTTTKDAGMDAIAKARADARREGVGQ